LAFAAVPFCEDFGGGCAAEDTRVDETREADVGDVAGGAEDAFKVPDGFCSVVASVSVSFPSILLSIS